MVTLCDASEMAKEENRKKLLEDLEELRKIIKAEDVRSMIHFVKYFTEDGESRHRTISSQYENVESFIGQMVLGIVDLINLSKVEEYES